MGRFDIDSVFSQFDYIDKQLNELPSKLEVIWSMRVLHITTSNLNKT